MHLRPGHTFVFTSRMRRTWHSECCDGLGFRVEGLGVGTYYHGYHKRIKYKVYDMVYFKIPGMFNQHVSKSNHLKGVRSQAL